MLIEVKMKIDIINTHKINYNEHNKNINSTKSQYIVKPSFSGVSFHLPKTDSYITTINHHKNAIKSVLQITSTEIQDLTRNKKLKNIEFLHNLATTYNTRNFLRYPHNEDITPLINIYKKILKVQPEHYDLLRELSLPFDKIEQIFTVTNSKNSKYIKQVLNLYNENFAHLESPLKSECFYKVITSKSSDEIVRNPNKFKSYILLNYKKENYIENLEKELEHNTFNPKIYDKKYNVKSIFSTSLLPETKVLNSNVLENVYSEEGCDLLKNYTKISRISKESLLDGNDAFLLNIYKSTNSENFNLRNRIINNFVKMHKDDLNNSFKYKQECKELFNIFNKLDTDKEAQKFVKHLMKDGYNILIKNLSLILDTIPARKLNRFYDNVLNIENQTNSKDLASVLLKEIENPFYKSYQRQTMQKYNYTTEASFITKKIMAFRNKINQFMYKKFDEPKLTLQEQEMLKNRIKPEITAETVAQIKQPQTKTVKLPIKKSLSKSKIDKFAVKNDINNVIQKHLTKGILERQQNTFMENATKLRLRLLPEIFRSISETRKADRLTGKVSGSSSKYDAVKLYQKINYNNKKIVNYMLKKRNADGTRMYDAKSILAYIADTEKHFAQLRNVNPQLKARDIKNLYNKKYDSLVAQYGKVKPLRNPKSSTDII